MKKYDEKIGKYPTFSGLVRLFEEEGAASLSLSSQKRYQSILGNFRFFFTDYYKDIRKLKDFTPDMIEHYKTYRKEQAQARTVNAELVILRKLFRLAQRRGWISRDPTSGLKNVKVQTRARLRYFSQEEARRFLAHCDAFWYPVFFTLLHTGLRKAELENLLWEQIDMDRRHICLKDREVPFSEELQEILQEQMYRAKGSAYVFPDEKGGRLFQNRLYKNFKSLLRKSSMADVRGLNVLRHTFAIRLLEKGSGLFFVRNVLGLTRLNSLALYEDFVLEKKQSELTDIHA